MKISVAVPTIAGRGKYLESCLATCISQDSDNMEILVSDNSEGDARDLVESIGDPRVRYIQPPCYLPMSAHWDFVLSNARGDVITFIGDDDGLMPGCISRVSEVLEENGNVPIHHSLCNYYWPDFVNEPDRNSVVFFHPADKERRWIKCDEFLSGICRGHLRYVDGPMIYHNFLPLPLVRNLARNGVFFRRASPDVYSSVAVAANVDRFFSLGEVLTLSGQGARANGASVRFGGGDGQKFLREMAHPLYLPRYKSKTIQLHLLDAVMEVADEFSADHLVNDVRFATYLASAIGEAGSFPGWRIKYQEFMEIGRIAVSQGVSLELLGLIGARALAKAQRILKKKDRVFTGEIASIGEAPANARIKLGNKVANIYQASLALSALISKP